MAVQVIGNDVATLARTVERWQRGRGYFTVKIYEGSEAAIDALKESLYTGSGGTLDAFEKSRIGGKFQLVVDTAAAPSANITIEDQDAENDPTWELDSERLEKDLIDNAAFDSITATRAAALDRAISTHTALSSTASVHTFTTPSGTVTTSGTAEFNYCSLRLRGVESYLEFQSVIRRRWIVSKRSQLRAANNNVGRVESPPIPSNALVDLNNLEWLKMAPDVQEVGKNKFAITQEWVGAEEWSALLYGGSASP